MLAIVVLFIVTLTSAMQKQDEIVCRNIQVQIDYDSGISFLNEDEIKNRVNHLSGGAVIGKPLSLVDFRTIEKQVAKNPFVDQVDVFTNQSSHLMLNVKQKRPILRVINNDGVSYYISEKNERIPWCDNFTPHVAVALGNVETHSDPKRDSSIQAALYLLVQRIRNDEFLNAMMDQIYVTDTDEMEIVPKSGSHRIRLGTIQEDELDEKFKRLKNFYKEGLSKVGWTKYKSIDLRFKNQVVCVKNGTDSI